MKKFRRKFSQNPKTKAKAKARTFKAEAEVEAWTLEAKAKALNPWSQGQDQKHKFVSSILEAKACPRGLHHLYTYIYSTRKLKYTILFNINHF